MSFVEQRIVPAVRRLVDEPQDEVPPAGLAPSDQQSEDDAAATVSKRRTNQRKAEVHTTLPMAPATPEESRSSDRTPPEAAAATALDVSRSAKVAFAQRSKGRDCEDNHEESGLRSEHCPEDADIPDRREPRPIDHDAADACEREEEDDDGDQHANASQEHAPYASRGPGQGLTAAAVWVDDGNWRQARAVVRRKPSFGLAFPGDRRTDDNFRLLSLFGQACPRRGMRSFRV